MDEVTGTFYISKIVLIWSIFIQDRLYKEGDISKEREISINLAKTGTEQSLVLMFIQ